jgi:cytochrome c biogenesis protein CcmG, thiol:disulfide interchange protein DsbE
VDPESPATEPAPETPGRDRGRLIAGIAVGVGVLLVVVLLVVGLANRGDKTDIAREVAAGERPPAPDLTLPVLTAAGGVGPVGSQVALKDLRGKPVLVNVWASWCVPCRDEAPVLEGLWRKVRGSGALVLGMDVQDVSDDARAFTRQFRLSYPSLRDGNGTDVRKGFETTGVPETYLVDPQGRIAWRHIGPVTQAEAAQVQALIERL